MTTRLPLPDGQTPNDVFTVQNFFSQVQWAVTVMVGRLVPDGRILPGNRVKPPRRFHFIAGNLFHFRDHAGAGGGQCSTQLFRQWLGAGIRMLNTSPKFFDSRSGGEHASLAPA